ncbi:MAG: PilZ domain-containing protein [Anaerolineales bacterium]|nr:PilZ domain-containing protein [Anaerolineales bacterium]
METSERRKTKRFSVVELDIFDNKTDDYIGKMINLSVGGMLILGDNPLETGKIYHIKIPFDETVNGRVNFDIETKCVWCTNAIGFPRYSIGLQFLDNSSVHYTFIKKMVDTFSAT